jgi:signal transduction histidine kinase
LRNTLLSRLPHELRTPLIGILGVGELLGYDAESLTAAEITEYADIITTSGQQLYRLVENHLLYAQLELLALSSPQATICDPNLMTPVADVIRSTCQRLLTEKGKEQYKTAMDLDLQMALVPLSPDDVAKIAYELVDNACKFSAAAATVTISGTVTSERYQLVVRDQGRGIAPENLTRIGPFVQFDRMQYEQQGSGLGLAIVQRLVQLARGTLHIDSTPTVGTTVTVTLPLA